MPVPNKTRGEYRPIYESLFHSQEYAELSADAKLVLLTLKGLSGPLGVKSWPALDATLAALCKISSRRCRSAVEELRESRWIERENAVVWVVNGLKFEPSMSTGAKHRTFVRKTLDALPRCELLARFRAKYADYINEPGADRVSGSPSDRVSDTQYDTTTPSPTPTNNSNNSSGRAVRAPGGTPGGVPRARRAASPPATKKPPNWPAFTQEHCGALYDAWCQKLSAFPYPRFRKALGPVYQQVATQELDGRDAVTVEQLDEAFSAALTLAEYGRNANRFTPEFLAGSLVLLARTRAKCGDDSHMRTEKSFFVIHGHHQAQTQRAG